MRDNERSAVGSRNDVRLDSEGLAQELGDDHVARRTRSDHFAVRQEDQPIAGPRRQAQVMRDDQRRPTSRPRQSSSADSFEPLTTSASA